MRRTILVLAALSLGGCDHDPHPLGPDVGFGPSGGNIEGSGNVITQSRSITDFQAVSFNGIGHLVIEQTGTNSLTVTADDNLLPVLVSNVVNGSLRLGVARDTNIGRVSQIVFHLTVVSLDALSAAGAATIEATDIDGETIDIHLSGAITASISGHADRQDISLTGASTYQASALDSREVVVDAVGASSVTLRVSERLDARVRGASLITYIGDPVVTVDGPPGSVQRQ